MNLTILQTFLAIVETGSLVRASERLNVTQSTVTARLKSLEDDLGQTLVYRQKSGASLTSSGRKFKRSAEAMLELWQQARQETSLPDGIDAVCRIGCHMDLWPQLGKPLFGALYRDRQSLALSAWPGEQVELDRWLGTGLVDAALTYHPVAHDNQSVHALEPEKLVLVSDRKGSP
ncbi:MAG: LysR family transcriptional regulator, partial [Rhizobiales bacterium]|nr:LysR family transcriptional regulator [Hyphomicrobiales bacterium]